MEEIKQKKTGKPEKGKWMEGDHGVSSEIKMVWDLTHSPQLTGMPA